MAATVETDSVDLLRELSRVAGGQTARHGICNSRAALQHHARQSLPAADPVVRVRHCRGRARARDIGLVAGGSAAAGVRHPAPWAAPSAVLFITAHYDTQHGAFLFHPKFVDHVPLFFNACYASVFVAIAGVALKAARFAAADCVLRTALLLCAGACAVCLAAEITGRYTPGANDNGTGVALALWLASEYARRPADFPSDCDLRFLFAGSEEAGCRGMKAFLKSEAVTWTPAACAS